MDGGATRSISILIRVTVPSRLISSLPAGVSTTLMSFVSGTLIMSRLRLLTARRRKSDSIIIYSWLRPVGLAFAPLMYSWRPVGLAFAPLIMEKDTC